MKILMRVAIIVVVILTTAFFITSRLVGTHVHAQGNESFNVNLASVTGPSNGVGEGFLYGVSQDGTQPSDQYILPLGITGFRGGGHVSRGWIGDNYTYGSQTQADVNTVIAQAKRLTQGSYHAQYQILLSDVFGADAGQPSNTVYPCTNGNCSNWVTFLNNVIGAFQAAHLSNVAYEIWNEPDLSIFWGGGGWNSTQYFQMWDTAVQTIRSLAPGVPIVGPSAAFTPQQNSSGWQTWFQHLKSAGTLPNFISNHNEGDGDDPVAVANSINADLASDGISSIPLSSNEYQPSDQQTVGVNAWYLARFAQSGYTNAMRGNWICCLNPNLAGVLNSSGQPEGLWWAMRTYADMTGSLVSTSGEVGSTAISAVEDSSHRRAVAILGDENGYTGGASVTFSGLSSVSWLANNGNVEAIVYRIPDNSPLLSPQVVSDQVMSTSSGSVTVNFTFAASGDAFAIYLMPGFAQNFSSTLVNQSTASCMDENNWTTVSGAQFDEWSCNGGTNQQFTFTPTSAGSSTYFIHPMTPDYCVDIAGSSTTSGAAVTQYPCTYTNNEQFALHSVGTNVYQVVAQNSGLCIAPSGGSSSNGTGIIQVSCNSSATSWTINAPAVPPTATSQPGTSTPVPPTVTPVPPTATPQPGTATPVPPTATPGSSACKVTYAVSSQWTGGFSANVTIANTGSAAINGWTLKFAFPATGQTVTQGWSATWSQSGQNVTATNLSWNSSLAVGASTSIGFNGAWTSSNPSPTSFTLNGATCTKG
jgi:Cellulose binding domain/Ricin-type beta-trefoil lectin domain/Glycosyl hydrolases family 39